MKTSIKFDKDDGMRPVDRNVYRTHDLTRLLMPRSIALVGASPNASSFGFKTLANTTSFDGSVYLINEKYEDINGQP